MDPTRGRGCSKSAAEDERRQSASQREDRTPSPHTRIATRLRDLLQRREQETEASASRRLRDMHLHDPDRRPGPVRAPHVAPVPVNRLQAHQAARARGAPRHSAATPTSLGGYNSVLYSRLMGREEGTPAHSHSSSVDSPESPPSPPFPPSPQPSSTQSMSPLSGSPATVSYDRTSPSKSEAIEVQRMADDRRYAQLSAAHSVRTSRGPGGASLQESDLRISLPQPPHPPWVQSNSHAADITAWGLPSTTPEPPQPRPTSVSVGLDTGDNSGVENNRRRRDPAVLNGAPLLSELLRRDFTDHRGNLRDRGSSPPDSAW